MEMQCMGNYTRGRQRDVEYRWNFCNFIQLFTRSFSFLFLPQRASSSADFSYVLSARFSAHFWSQGRDDTQRPVPSRYRVAGLSVLLLSLLV